MRLTSTIKELNSTLKTQIEAGIQANRAFLECETTKLTKRHEKDNELALKNFNDIKLLYKQVNEKMLDYASKEQISILENADRQMQKQNDIDLSQL